MDTVLSDVQYAFRRLRASPGFALAALTTIAMGIGANTAMFTIVNAVMLRPMAVDRPERLVEIYTTDRDGIPATSSYPDFLDLRDQPVFEGGIAAYNPTLLYRSDAGQSTPLLGEAVSGSYFEVLGLRPTLGRFFGPDEDRAGAPGVVVLGHGYWRRRFGADPGVLGRTLTLNGDVATILGVGPTSYAGGIAAVAVDVWVPLNFDFDASGDRAAFRTERGTRSLFMRARLADGASVEQARAALQVEAGRLAAAYPDTNRNRMLTVLPVSDIRFHPAVDRVLAPVAVLVMAVPGLVLLIACANVANLLLARASGRTREIAVRLAIGAGRGRLIRQLLTESTVLSVIGGALGLILAWWLMRLAEGWKPEGLPIPLVLDLRLDHRVLWFTVVASIATGLVFGLAPALQATRPSVVPALKDEGGVVFQSHRRFGLRNGLVVAQVAVSLVLLTAAGLFVRSLQHAQEIDPGFERERAVIFTPALLLTDMSTEARVALTDALRERFAALPGVERVALADRVPLGASVRTTDVLVDDMTADANGRGVDVDQGIIGPGYFAALGIPLLNGRDFSETDSATAPGVAIVSEAFARRYWPNRDAIGGRVRFPARAGRPERPVMQVIGVARDTRVRTLGEEPRPYLYLPYRQTDEDVGFVIRTAGAPAPLVPVVRREALALKPDLPIFELETMREHLSLMVTPPRLAAMLLGASGTLAVLLASLGLYAVVAYSVARRTKEIGIRVALGAGRGQVMLLVVREGMALVGAGIALGFVLTLALTRPLGAYLYGLESFDPLTFGSVAAVLAGAALLANYLPARRAVRVDPLKAIRYE